ncbi:MAG TPA: glycine cleavage T C-terminal barrel domain-containing protein [Acidimicrobiales bacterium]|nr:glycine cleavage T C-terminal barrel domain-containing protein [Acidimicrobiales bacterium]
MTVDPALTDTVDLQSMLGAFVVDRDVVRVSGPDSVAYLQGQLSQDVEGLAVGATTWSFVLQPTGKVEVWARVTRTGDDGYLLDLDRGAGEQLVTRLRRFLLRTDATIEPLAGWRCVALRGPGAVGAAPAAAIAAGAELQVPAGWPGVESVDLLGPEVTVPDDIPVADPDAYEALRIAAGVPAMNAELTDKTIPAEAGQWVVDASVSFTKGCFTGQELVARIDSRGGNVPRHLRGVVLAVAGATLPPAGAVVTVDDAEVGTITSAAHSPLLRAPVALAYVSRAVDPTEEGVASIVTWADEQVPAMIRTLPLVDRG